MKTLALKISTAAATFALGLAIVWTINSAYSAFEARYPIPEVPLTPITKPEFPEPRPVMDYEPLYWPRVKGARLAIPGRALNEEPVTSGYEKWLGLYKSASGYEVREAQVKVSSFKERDVEGGWYEMRRVQTAGRGKPVFVFKGIDAIKPGRVPTFFSFFPSGDARAYTSDGICYGHKFTLNGADYSVFAKDFIEYESNCFGGTAFLSDGVTKQMINDPEENDGSHMAYTDSMLVWVGDLDGDRKLDLLIKLGDAPCTYYYTQHVLYLSSYARPGELVAPVATYQNFEY